MVKEKASVQDIVVQRLLEKIEAEGRLPWQKPFQGASMNWFSKHEYTGINKLLLDAGEYITPKQLEQYNQSKKTRFWFEKGTPSEIVVFYSRIEKIISPTEAQEMIKKGYAKVIYPTDKGWVRVSWLLRFYRVYNIKYMRNITNEELLKDPRFKDGIFEKLEKETPKGTRYRLKEKGGKPILKEGVTEADFEVLEPKLGTTVVENHTPSEEIIAAYQAGTGVKLKHGGGEAFYTEFDDTVTLPDINNFLSTEAYCRVLFHEFIHSTGIKKRLNRDCFKEYHEAKTERSKEELIAEVGGLLLASEAGFREDTELAQNSENYVANWCKWMKDNPNLVVQGLFAAEKAKNYILSGGKLEDASSTRSIDNPNEKSEDADVDTNEPSDQTSTTTPENDESSSTTSTSNDDVKPKSVKSIKTIKGVKEYFAKYLAPYFETEDEVKKKEILDSVKADELKYIYKKVTKEDMPSAIRKKADALQLIAKRMGI